MPPYKKEATKSYAINNNMTSNTNLINNNKIVNSCDIKSTKTVYRMQIVWYSVFKLTLLHIIAIYGAYLAGTQAKYQTVIWAYLVAMSSGFGILSGAHRLWSHKCYKARYPLRVLLMILETLALQNDIYEWCRDHRVHHKYAETDADPHNSKRGFFFAHMGWLMVKKHPQVIEKGKQIDLSDILSDPIVRFQRKYYATLVIIIWGIIPTVIPCYFWSETLIVSFALNMTRYTMSLHQAWLVNSAAHMVGYKPYDRNIASRENSSVIYLSLGEGYHNYHHTFPYDYSASEYGWKINFNLATAFIDFFAMLGLAYDRRVASNTAITNRKLRTGENLIRVKKNTLIDYICGVIITTWPVWLAFSARAVYF